jgi:hypothetical protein
MMLLSTIASPSTQRQQPTRISCYNQHRRRLITSCKTSPSFPPYSSWPKRVRAAVTTGIYISVAGFVLLVKPDLLTNYLLSDSFLFSHLSTSPLLLGLTRVGATLACLFGFYYLGAASDDLEGRTPTRFYQSTVYGRFFLTAVVVWLVVTGQVGRTLFPILAAINLVSAISLHIALGK